MRCPSSRPDIGENPCLSGCVHRMEPPVSYRQPVTGQGWLTDISLQIPESMSSTFDVRGRAEAFMKLTNARVD
ncbi:hypothetical protein R54767_02597 [Paraburkholderia gardini]|uniref:Uncharacterized protein n=1 Tax=Paraburkholderia gardini TaxID=2823469 RepID=A0ABM8U3Z0_9BURK|nr:hypothetical protein R54767_02597 [Paraburkholderia gardini]